jgi:hypothetical protein
MIKLLTDYEARIRYGESEQWMGDGIDHGANATPAMLRTIADLAEAFGEHATLEVMRDWEGCGVIVADDPSQQHIGDIFAITDLGHIGHGGVNMPRYYASVAELLARDLTRTTDRLVEARG